MDGLKLGDHVHLYGYPEMGGPVTALLGECGGARYAKFMCAVHKRETGWLRFDQLRREGGVWLG